MKRFCIFTLLLCLGCTEGSKFLDAINSITMITGRIVAYDSTTGTIVGVAGAKVMVRTENKYTETLTLADDATTTAVETGIFYVDDILASAQSVQIIVSATGYSNYNIKVNTFVADVEPLRHYDLGDLTLVTSNGSISGTVFGVDGPLSNVKVICQNTSNAAGGFFDDATTDSSGNFSISGVPETSGYVCSNMPVDVNSDGFYDYASQTSAVDLSMSANQTSRRAYLVLPFIDTTFNIVYSNIGHGWDNGMNTAPSLDADDSISLYFNNIVSNDSNLWVSLTDVDNNVIPVTTSVSNNVVTVTPQNNLSYGYNYMLDINAQSVIGELYSPALQTFWVLNDTSPNAISDFAVNWSDTNTLNSTSVTTFDSLVDAKSSNFDNVSMVFGFSLPSNYTHITLHVRNDEPDSAYRHFDFSQDLSFNLVAPLYNGDTSCSLTTPCETGITEIKSSLAKSGETSGKIIVGSLKTYFEDPQALLYTGETRSVFLALRACNDEQISTALSDYSDNCVISSIAQLDYTK